MSKKGVSFEEWKKTKIERGEWLSPEDYRRKKDIERRDYLLKELELVNRRLNPRSHEDLRSEFETFEKSHKKRKLEEDFDKIKREVILDTETTGLTNSDKIVEISIIEMIDGIKTGRRYHKFLNPEINITKKAVEIHKITNESLKDCCKFPDVAEEIIKFIGDATIIAHNSGFDMRMINNELERCGWQKYKKNRFIDTLEIARYLFPDQKNNQDALCERFNINNSIRSETGIHSAVEDTALLYLIYQEFIKLLKEKELTPYDFKQEIPKLLGILTVLFFLEVFLLFFLGDIIVFLTKYLDPSTESSVIISVSSKVSSGTSLKTDIRSEDFLTGDFFLGLFFFFVDFFLPFSFFFCFISLIFLPHSIASLEPFFILALVGTFFLGVVNRFGIFILFLYYLYKNNFV